MFLSNVVVQKCSIKFSINCYALLPRSLVQRVREERPEGVINPDVTDVGGNEEEEEVEVKEKPPSREPSKEKSMESIATGTPETGIGPVVLRDVKRRRKIERTCG